MHWNGYGWHPTPPAPPMAESPTTTHLLIDLNRSVSKLSHSTGRIEGELQHVRKRLDEGDDNFREIRADLAHLKSEAAGKAEPSSRLENFKTLAETLVPLIKESWPFLAVVGAGVVRFLGFDLGAHFGP